MVRLTLEEAQKYLMIDKNQLDYACTSQSSVFYEIAEACAVALSVRDQAKEQLEVADAIIASNYRQTGEKLTEAKLEQMIVVHPDHSQAFHNFNEAKLIAEKWGALKEAFSQRAFMIKELCGLALASYYSEISVSSETKADTQKAREIIKKKLLETQLNKDGIKGDETK